MDFKDLVVSIALNICLMMASAFLVNRVYSSVNKSMLKNRLVLGCIFGIVSLSCMFLPIQLAPGIIFDMRVVVVGIASLFGGLASGLIAAIFPSIYRVYLGGMGLYAGLAAIWSAALLGGALYKLLKGRSRLPKYWHLILSGEVTALAALISVFLLPASANPLAIFKRISIAVPVMYPIGSLLFGTIILLELQRYSNLRRIEQSELRFRGLFEDTPISLWEEDFSKVKLALDQLRTQKGVGDFSVYLKNNPDYIFQLAKTIQVTNVNRATLELLECADKQQLLGPILAETKRFLSLQEELLAIWDSQFYLESQGDILSNNGKVKRVMTKWFVPQGYREDYSRVIVAMTDLTELTEMQGQLQQANKMQAIGQLAGGIAHDFNNLLGGIMGYTDLSLEELDPQSPVYEYQQYILQASIRAKDMIRKILTFSRRSKDHIQSLNLESILQEVLALMKTSIPQDVIIETNIDFAIKPVWADETQIHEIIMNLITNGLHAMQGKGILRINLKNLTVAQQTEGFLGPIPIGEYTLLEIQDNGMGMNQTTIERIFEPFYTTKDKAKGTGLGLSMIYGALQTYMGNIQVESLLGEGTLFRLFFPTSEDALEQLENVISLKRGKERVLFVEDEPLILQMSQQMLEGLGYEVFPFRSGNDALAYFNNHQNDVEILVTDQLMPGMTGIELGAKIQKINPKIPIIICHSATSNIPDDALENLERVRLVKKPLRYHSFSNIIRDVLDN